MIDPHKLVLYRLVGEDMEDVIPIQMNRDVRNFLCLDSKEYESMVQDILEQRK